MIYDDWLIQHGRFSSSQSVKNRFISVPFFGSFADDPPLEGVNFPIGSLKSWGFPVTRLKNFRDPECPETSGFGQGLVNVPFWGFWTSLPSICCRLYPQYLADVQLIRTFANPWYRLAYLRFLSTRISICKAHLTLTPHGQDDPGHLRFLVSFICNHWIMLFHLRGGDFSETIQIYPIPLWTK